MKVDKLKLGELDLLDSVLSDYDSINSLKGEIARRKKELEEENNKSLNVRFNMDYFIKLQIFTPPEFEVVKKNNINNIQELLDCDLDSLEGITPSVKRGLEWCRRVYDMSSFEKSKKRRKGK